MRLLLLFSVLLVSSVAADVAYRRCLYANVTLAAGFLPGDGVWWDHVDPACCGTPSSEKDMEIARLTHEIMTSFRKINANYRKAVAEWNGAIEAMLHAKVSKWVRRTWWDEYVDPVCRHGKRYDRYQAAHLDESIRYHQILRDRYRQRHPIRHWAQEHAEELTLAGFAALLVAVACW